MSTPSTTSRTHHRTRLARVLDWAGRWVDPALYAFNRAMRAHHVPIHVSPVFVWVALWRSSGARCGRFREVPGVIKRGRWGGYVLGLEVGYRG